MTQKSEFFFLEGTKKESDKCYQEKDYTCGWVSGVCKNVLNIEITDDKCKSVLLGGGSYPDSIGMCVYTDLTTDNCEDDGFLDVNWEAAWEWAIGNSEHKDPTGENAKCKDTQKTQPCASQVVLAFFTIKNTILVVAAIILIYIVRNGIKYRKKKRK